MPGARALCSLPHLATEPFRIFFPAAVLAGILGAAVWPLHLLGWIETYPGQSHARLMAHGFFGGFILGFLGTALPRLIAARSFTLPEVALQLLCHTGMVAALTAGKLVAADIALLGLLLTFAGGSLFRFVKRRDLPPPGFVLVALAFVCASIGAILSLAQDSAEWPVFWIRLQRLLSVQAFVLLPILGVGGFILPRFLGLPNLQDLPESRRPTPLWWKRTSRAALVGAGVVVSLLLEAEGWTGIGISLRLLLVVTHLTVELPFLRSDIPRNALADTLRLALLLLPAGYLAIVLFPGYPTGLLHLTLIGGFALITLTVATRVVFGHTGNADRLSDRNRWYRVMVVLILIGMLSRISGDLWPKIMATHYGYGAILWIAGLGLWAFRVLPKLRDADPDE